MFLDDVQLIFAHWRRSPPLRMLVSAIAAALGYKLPDPSTSAPNPAQKYMTADEFARLVAITGGRLD